ncbi:MAG: hypothetical protein JO100_09840 [Pseudonocardia sp.]|nr:hypothetical protein [Pseudonocardia sp.]
MSEVTWLAARQASAEIAGAARQRRASRGGVRLDVRFEKALGDKLVRRDGTPAWVRKS